jgi:ferredoxin
MTAQRLTITLEGHGAASGYVDERVLVALERAQGFGKLKGLPRRLPVGCRRGGCGICRVRVTSGDYRRAPMSRDHVSAEDEAAGVVLACCIYPLSDLSLRLETPVAVKAKARKAEPSTV